MLGDIETDGNNKILKNLTNFVPFKYLSNFRRSLEMSSINHKIDNNDFNSNNIMFVFKETNLYVPTVTLSQKYIKNYQNFLEKYWKDLFMGVNINQKMRIKLH